MASSNAEDTRTGTIRASPEESDPLLPKDASPSGGCLSLGLGEWCRELQRHYGWRLLVLVFALQHVLNGFVRNLTGAVGMQPYLFRSYNMPAPMVGVANSVLDSVWVMAPLVALVTDIFPVNGYNKAPYVALSAAFGTGACLAIWLLPGMSERVALLSLFVLQLEQVTATVCCTGAYVQRAQRHQRHGADLQTFVSFGIEAGGLAGSALVGPVFEYLGPRAAWGVSVLPAAAAVAVAAGGFFEEKPVGEDELVRKRQCLWEQREACGLAVLLFASTMLTNSFTFGYGNLHSNAIGYVIAGIIVLLTFSVVLSPKIARVSAFSIVYNSLSVNVDSALFYFYTDMPEMYAEGPHLPSLFYNSVRGPVFALFALVGIYTYNRFMKEWPYRRAIVVSNMAYCAVLASTLLIVTRANLRLGIPDKVFVLVHAALRSMTSQWTRMPFRVLFMYLCPNQMEATMYALLKGTSDLGNSINDSLGGVLLSSLGCRPSGTIDESASFQNLGTAVSIAAVAPFAAAALLLRLIPDALPNRRLVSEVDYDATSGSLWTEWLGPKATRGKGPASTVLSQASTTADAEKC